MALPFLFWFSPAVLFIPCPAWSNAAGVPRGPQVVSPGRVRLKERREKERLDKPQCLFETWHKSIRRKDSTISIIDHLITLERIFLRRPEGLYAVAD
jgi:hypothetical protein